MCQGEEDRLLSDPRALMPPRLAFVAAALLGWPVGSMVALAPSLATPKAPLTRPHCRGRLGGGGQAPSTAVGPPGCGWSFGSAERRRRRRLEQTEASSAVGPSLGCPCWFDASPDRGKSGKRPGRLTGPIRARADGGDRRAARNDGSADCAEHDRPGQRHTEPRAGDATGDKVAD